MEQRGFLQSSIGMKYTALALLSLTVSVVARLGNGSATPPTGKEYFNHLCASPIICAGAVLSVEVTGQDKPRSATHAFVVRVDHSIKGTLPQKIRIYLPESWVSGQAGIEFWRKKISGSRFVFFLKPAEGEKDGFLFSSSQPRHDRGLIMIPAGDARRLQERTQPNETWHGELEEEILAGVLDEDQGIASGWLSILIAAELKTDRAISAVRKVAESELLGTASEAKAYLDSIGVVPDQGSMTGPNQD
jgi:hypothetical protein